MNELSEVCRAGRAIAARGEPLWLATVMRVKGSAYRHAGARMLFTSGRVLAGSVSGGCLEQGLVRKGPWLTRERPACLHFAGTQEEEDDELSSSGTGCDGAVDVLVERVLHEAGGVDPLAFIDHRLANEQRGALITVFNSSDSSVPIGSRLTLCERGQISCSIPNSEISSDLAPLAEHALEQRAGCREIHGDGFDALLEIVQPPPRLFIFGAGPDALPVADFASALGLGVTVCANSARPSERERFRDRAELHIGQVGSARLLIEARRSALAVVMSHHYETDAAALSMLLDSSAEYIGMLGPARRTQRMLKEIGRDPLSLSARDRARLRSPIGLDLGAETPSQIALSIVSEIQSLLAHTEAEPLSRRGPRPIHTSDEAWHLELQTPWARTGST